MQNKKGISLIVLVITIIVMIILAAAVVLTLGNTGIINRAEDAVKGNDIKQVQYLASLAWADAYSDGKTTQVELEKYVMDELEKNKINTDNYVILVTTEGVTVNFPAISGLYASGSRFTKLIASWEELLNQGMIKVEDGAVAIGTVKLDMPALNENGFCYGVEYVEPTQGIGFAFLQDGSVNLYMGGVLAQSMPAGTAIYSWKSITINGMSVTVSPDGTSITLPEGQGTLALNLNAPAQLNGDLLMPNDGTIKSISQFGFASQTKLTSLVIPDSVTTIGLLAFTGCTSLESITMPCSELDGTDDDNRFNYLFGTVPESLKKLTITPGTINKAGIITKSSFSNSDSNITDIIISEGITIIEDSAFEFNTSLVSVTIPDSVTEIGRSAFNYCIKLSELNLSENSELRVINSDAFDETNLKSIKLPGKVEIIGQHAFSRCKSLTDVFIPSSVKTIVSYAFQYSTNLETVTFGENSQLTSIGQSAFSGCENLKAIEIPSSLAETGTFVFSGCKSLKNLTFGENCKLKKIELDMFSGCTSLESVEIPPEVTSIEHYAFSSCENLTSVKIPVNVTKIDFNAFSDCKKLTAIYYDGTTTQWKDGTITFGNNWDKNTPAYIVYCSDGTVSKTGTVTPNA